MAMYLLRLTLVCMLSVMAMSYPEDDPTAKARGWVGVDTTGLMNDWVDMDQLDRIGDLVEKIMDMQGFNEVRSEFEEYKRATSDDKLDRTCFREHMVEFQSPTVVDDFFDACDTDSDGNVTWEEFLICRGDFDKYGTPSVKNEYGEYNDHINFESDHHRVPKGLKEETQWDFDREYEFDEEGMIID